MEELAETAHALDPKKINSALAELGLPDVYKKGDTLVSFTTVRQKYSELTTATRGVEVVPPHIAAAYETIEKAYTIAGKEVLRKLEATKAGSVARDVDVTVYKRGGWHGFDMTDLLDWFDEEEQKEQTPAE